MNLLEIIALALIILSSVLVFYRLIIGPGNADRLVSADALSLIATVSLVILAALFKSPLYLDIALIYAVLSFVGMIALAHVIETNCMTQTSLSKTEKEDKS